MSLDMRTRQPQVITNELLLDIANRDASIKWSADANEIGIEVVRAREFRHPDPASNEPVRIYDLVEFLKIPEFGLGVYPILSWCNEADTTVGFGATAYIPLNTADAPNATEADAEILITRVGKLARLHIRVTANTLDGATAITVRKNGADTAITLSIAATDTGVFTSPLAVDTLPEDRLTISVVVAGSEGAVTIKQASIEIQ